MYYMKILCLIKIVLNNGHCTGSYLNSGEWRNDRWNNLYCGITARGIRGGNFRHSCQGNQVWRFMVAEKRRSLQGWSGNPCKAAYSQRITFKSEFWNSQKMIFYFFFDYSLSFFLRNCYEMTTEPLLFMVWCIFEYWSSSWFFDRYTKKTFTPRIY